MRGSLRSPRQQPASRASSAQVAIPITTRQFQVTVVQRSHDFGNGLRPPPGLRTRSGSSSSPQATPRVPARWCYGRPRWPATPRQCLHGRPSRPPPPQNAAVRVRPAKDRAPQIAHGWPIHQSQADATSIIPGRESHHLKSRANADSLIHERGLTTWWDVDCRMYTTAWRAKRLGVTSSDFMRDLRQNRGDVFDDLASERGRQRQQRAAGSMLMCVGTIHCRLKVE